MAQRRAGAAAPERLFADVVEVLSKEASLEQGKMFGAQGLKVGGKVFAMLYKGEMVVKLPSARVEALIRSGKGRPFDPGHGRVMKEWVGIAPATSGWADLAREARGFVRG